MTNDYKRQWEPRRGGRSVGDAARDSYYGLPVVKAPHWDWKIVLYFFLGGISSASYVVACIAELIGGRTNSQIARVGRYLSLITLIPSPILLILDLGRPERFHHMLRVVKLRSPMSVGTWGLSAYGLFTTLSTGRQAACDGLLDWFPFATRLLVVLPTKPLNLIGSFWGFFVAGYTGVLLGITAIPIWGKNHLLLGPLFLSSALSSATAAMTLVLALARGDTQAARKRLHRIERVALLCELTLLLASWANSGRVIRKPFGDKQLGQLFRWGVLGTGICLPLVLQRCESRGSKPSRVITSLGSLCALVGGYCLRHLWVYAGHASAADPHATFAFTRRVE